MTAAVVLAATTGCTTLRPVAAPQQFIASRQPPRVRVTRTDGTVVSVRRPRLFGDTLTGWVAGRYEELPLVEVRQVAAPQPAGARTALLVTGIAASLVAVVVLTQGGGQSPDPGIEYRRQRP